jgi:hypothetical protein
MSLGRPKVVVRFDPQDIESIREAIESRNNFCADSPYTVSDWIRDCVRQKLSHLARARARGNRVELVHHPARAASPLAGRAGRVELIHHPARDASPLARRASSAEDGE